MVVSLMRLAVAADPQGPAERGRMNGTRRVGAGEGG